MTSSIPALKFKLLTPENWVDLEVLFGERGACGGCWCMHWRLTASDYARGKGASNKRKLKALSRKQPPGLIAYAGGEPVGWCSFGPRASFVRLETSRVLRPVDDAATWSIVCLFIRKDYRRRGLSSALLRAAAGFAAKQGARLLEAYPVDPSGEQADVFVFTGLLPAYLKCGFREVARRSPTRPVVRLKLK